jgi:hypothetical protein
MKLATLYVPILKYETIEVCKNFVKGNHVYLSTVLSQMAQRRFKLRTRKTTEDDCSGIGPIFELEFTRNFITGSSHKILQI